MKLPCPDQMQGNLATRNLNEPLAAAAKDSPSLQQTSNPAPDLHEDLCPVTALFWGSGYGVRMVKKHRSFNIIFFNQKAPENRLTIPYSAAFTSPRRSPKRNYRTKQAIKHNRPRIFLEWASLQVRNYRALKLRYTPQKQGADMGKHRQDGYSGCFSSDLLWVNTRSSSEGPPGPERHRVVLTARCPRELGKHQ